MIPLNGGLKIASRCFGAPCATEPASEEENSDFTQGTLGWGLHSGGREGLCLESPVIGIVASSAERDGSALVCMKDWICCCVGVYPGYQGENKC